MRQWAYSLTALFVLSALGVPAAAKDKHAVGERVPVFTLKAVNPETAGAKYVSLEDYVGAAAQTSKKAVLLSFFATYCKPCKREIPFLAALHDTYENDGLQVLVVSIDKEKDKIQVAKDLAEEHGVGFPVLSDRFNIVAKRYFVSKLPNLYLLNGEGKVSMVSVGYNDDITRQVLDEVRQAVGEPASEPIPEAIAKHLEAGGETAATKDEKVASQAEGRVEEDARKRRLKRKRRLRKKRRQRRRRQRRRNR